MHPHRRSYSHSAWKDNPHTPSKLRQSSAKLKRQYYYYTDPPETFPSFADTPFHLNESSINEDHRPSANSRWSLFHEPPSKSYGSRFEDPNAQLRKMGCQKMRNLEKINNKIKKILQTLDEEEKKINMNSYHPYKPQNPRQTRIKTEGDFTYNSTPPQPTMYSQLQHIREKYSRKSHENSENFLTNFNSQFRQRQQNKARVQTETAYEKENYPTRQESRRGKEVKASCGEENAFTFHRGRQEELRSYQTPIKEWGLKRSEVLEETRTRPIKNFDEEISKIQEKIHSFEKLKKELNIE